MKRQIALLRGINVGGKNALPMKELVGFFTSMGCAHVRTYIQSGNVVFASEKKWGAKEAQELSRRIGQEQGFSPSVITLSQSDLNKAIESSPFPIEDGKAVHFFFLDATPGNPDWKRLQERKAASEKYALQGKVFYLLAPNGIARSKLVPSVESALGVGATARNGNTVAKLASMLANSE